MNANSWLNKMNGFVENMHPGECGSDGVRVESLFAREMLRRRRLQFGFRGNIVCMKWQNACATRKMHHADCCAQAEQLSWWMRQKERIGKQKRRTGRCCCRKKYSRVNKIMFGMFTIKRAQFVRKAVGATEQRRTHNNKWNIICYAFESVHCDWGKICMPIFVPFRAMILLSFVRVFLFGGHA